MDDLAARVTEGLIAIVQPFVGKPEYGSPYIVAPFPNRPIEHPTAMVWEVRYRGLIFWQNTLQAINPQIAAYRSGETIGFRFSPRQYQEAVLGRDPQEVFDAFAQKLSDIPKERWSVLKMHATARTQECVSLDEAIEEVTRFSKWHPGYGPTEKEIANYGVFFTQPIKKGLIKTWE